MNQESKLIYISNLVSKQLLGKISQFELTELNHWIEEDDENRIIYDNFINEFDIETREEALSNIDENIAWNKINQSISERKERRLLQYIRYAAVIVIPLLSAIFLYNSYKSSSNLPELKYSQANIANQGAILYTDSGTEFQLNSIERDSIIDKSISYSAKEKELDYTDEEKAQKLSYHRIVVPLGSDYKLKLSDGTKVWLNADSELKYPKYFQGKIRKVFLKGEAYFEVAKNEKKKFIVVTQNMDIAVKGTSFNINAYENQDWVETTLVEGKVDASIKSLGSTITKYEMEPNSQTRLDKTNMKSEIRNVNIEPYIGWMKGYFYFEDYPLDRVLDNIARWYNIKIFYMNQSVKQIRYTGKVKKYKDVESILEMLEIGNNIKFEFNKNTIMVKQK